MPLADMPVIRHPPVVLRAFRDDDVGLIQAVATDELIPLERAGYTREGLLRSWQRVEPERRDMYMYSLL